MDALSKLETQGEGNTHINVDIPVAIIDLGDDKIETTSLSPYTVCHIYDREDHKPRTVMPEVQSLFQRQDPRWDRPPTSADFIAVQAQDSTFQQFAPTIGHAESKFNIDCNRLLVRKSTIDSAIQTVVPEVFEARVLYLAHNHSLA